MKIHFNYHEVGRPLKRVGPAKAWLARVAVDYGRAEGRLHYVFVSDEFLLEMNRTHLHHDYYTDIITFDLAEPGGEALEGEIYISVDRVKDNARLLGLPFHQELHRVMVHGLLHLLGLPDKTPAQARRMRSAEEEMLVLLSVNPQGDPEASETATVHPISSPPLPPS